MSPHPPIMEDPAQEQDPARPQGPHPPILLPPTDDPYQARQSFKMMELLLQQRSQQIDLNWYKQLAAQGQMQSYQEAQARQVLGQNLVEDTALLNAGLPLADVRQPAIRQAYGDAFADLSARQAQSPEGVTPEFMELQQRHKGFVNLSDTVQEDRRFIGEQMRGELERQALSSTSAKRTLGHLAAPITGLVGIQPRSREEGFQELMNSLGDQLEEARFPGSIKGARRTGLAGDAGQTVPVKVASVSKRDMTGVDRKAYRRAINAEIYDHVTQAMEKAPQLKTGDLERFRNEVAEALGLFVPFTGAAKVGGLTAKAVQGPVKKAVLGMAGSSVAMGAYGAALELRPDQKAHIESLPEGDRKAAETAAHIEGAISMGLMYPVFSIFGGLGGKLGSKVGGKLFGGVGKAAGSAVGAGGAMPIVPELEAWGKHIAAGEFPELQRMIDAQIVSKPELQGPLAGMLKSLRDGSADAFFTNLVRYGRAAAPAMVAFGTAHMVIGMRNAIANRGPAFSEKAVALIEKQEKQALAEAEKVLGPGEPAVTEQVKANLTRKVEETREELLGPKTEEQKLGEKIGPEEATRKVDEAELVRELEPGFSPEKPPTEKAFREDLLGRQTELRAKFEEGDLAAGADLEIAYAKNRVLFYRRYGAQDRAADWAEHAKAMETWKAAGMQGAEPARPTGAAPTPEMRQSRGMAKAVRGKKPREKVAKEIAAYEGSPEQKLAQEAEAGVPRAGHEVELEGKRYEVTVVEGEHARMRFGDETELLPLEKGGKLPPEARIVGEVTRLNDTRASSPTEVVETADPVARAHEDTVRAHQRGEPAPQEAKRTLQRAQKQAQEEAHGLDKPLQERESTEPSADPVEAKTLKAQAEETGTSTAAAPLVAELKRQGREVPKGEAETTAPPRPQGEAFKPNPEELPRLAEIETQAAVVGRSKSYRLLAELRSGAGGKWDASVAEWARITQGKAAGAGEREFLTWLADNAALGNKWKGHRYAAEMLWEYVKQKHGIKAGSMGEIQQALGTELAESLRVATTTKDPAFLRQWINRRSDLLAGPWSAAARYYKPAQELLARVNDLQNGRQSGFAALDLFDPIAWLQGTRRALNEQRQQNLDAMVADYKSGVKRAGVTRRYLKILEMPLTAFGKFGVEGAIAIQRAKTDMVASIEEVLHTKTGYLAGIERGSALDARVFELLGADLRSPAWQAARANAADAPARRAALLVKRWERKIKNVLVEVHPVAVRTRRWLKTFQEDLRTLVTDGQALKQKILATTDPVEQRRLGRGLNSITREIKQLKEQRERLRAQHDDFKQGWGVKDYVHHVSKYELDPKSTAMSFIRDLESGVIRDEVRRSVTRGSVQKRKGVLERHDLLEKSAVQSLWAYVHDVIPYVRTQEFLARIDHEMYGLPQKLGKAAMKGGNRRVIWGAGEYRNIGVVRVTDVATTINGKPANVRTYKPWRHLSAAERATKGKEQVALWQGKDPIKPRQLMDDAWVRRNQRTAKNPNGQLVFLSKHDARRQLRAMQGGEWEKLEKIRRGDFRDFVEQVTTGGKELQRGQYAGEMARPTESAVGKVVDTARRAAVRAIRQTTSWVSMMILQGPTNAHNAANAVTSAITQNWLFKGGDFSRDVHRAMTQVIARHGRRARQSQAITQAPQPPYLATKTFAKLSGVFDQHYRTPEAKLARMTPARRARQEMVDDAVVALMESGVLGDTRADRMWGSWGDVRQGRVTRPGQIIPEWLPARGGLGFDKATGKPIITEPGALKKAGAVAGNLTAMAGVVGKPLGKAWTALYNAGEWIQRGPPFLEGYLGARKQGLSHDQALAEGFMNVHAKQFVTNRATRNRFFNNPAGAMLGNMSQWTAHAFGRFLNLPKKQQMELVAWNLALSSTAAALGWDLMDQFGGRVSNLPLVGERLNSWILGLGVSTEKDPQGLNFKGPIWDFGARSVPIPWPMPMQLGPAAKIWGALAEAAVHWSVGNGELAENAFQRARQGIDPSRSTWWRQIQKSFNTIPQSDGTFLYQSQATGRGSTVLKHTGAAELLWQMLPGQDMDEANQWQQAQLERQKNAYLQEKHKELREKGLEWGRVANEARKGDLLHKQMEMDRRMELLQFADQVGRKRKREDLIGYMQDADLEQKLSGRERAALKAPTKERKLEQLADLLSDASYPLGNEKIAIILKEAAGKRAFMEWIWDKDVEPSSRAKLIAALKTRREANALAK